ncbi:Protein patched 1 [Desmophyllum pertusum]|uniref:Protein patched 1 n=1 Tax=Desmophyllum pertusum TaxID=174260 RepID=A0A9W9Z0K9_9CNID|nr:Protein patched 1 [Desmophyllum pertusum]
MFLLAHSYSTLARRGDIHHLEEVGYCLATTGVSVFLTSFNNMLAFFMAALITIPALRYFAIQAAVVVIFNFIGVIVIFPAMIGLDVRRRKRQRYDIICCIEGSTKAQGSVEVLSGARAASTNS